MSKYSAPEFSHDDSQDNIANARRHVATGHVPHGISNE
jgi:5'-nucleotidase